MFIASVTFTGTLNSEGHSQNLLNFDDEIAGCEWYSLFVRSKLISFLSCFKEGFDEIGTNSLDSEFSICFNPQFNVVSSMLDYTDQYRILSVTD